MKVQEALFSLLDKYSTVYKDELSNAKDFTGWFYTVQPKFYKARVVSFAVCQKVEAELNWL